MAREVVAVALVTAGAMARVGDPPGAGIALERGGVDDGADARPLGHLPRVPGEAVSRHIRDGVYPVAERTERLGGRPVQASHARDRRVAFRIVALGEREARAERLRQHQHVTGAPTRLAEHLVRVHDALHGQPEDRLGVADRVAAGNGAARLGHHSRGRFEDRRDRVAREVLGERGDVHRNGNTPAHGEHVAARVRGGNGAEVRRVVDEWREEVGRRHESDVVGEPVDRRIVERSEPDEQRRVGRSGEVGDEILQQGGAPFRRAASARRPFGEPEIVEAGSPQQGIGGGGGDGGLGHVT